jgi:D-glycero-D-manno-heptose 1,7-bisphosphate phosphatase
MIDEIVEAGGRIDGLYMCPHSPEDGCNCRKPLPGLILQAAQALSLDLERSILIGDAVTDIQSGQAAGIPTNILVETGRGSAQLQLFPISSILRYLIYSDLASAVERILLST